MTSKSELNQFTATKATPDTLPQRVAERRTLALGGRWMGLVGSNIFGRESLAEIRVNAAQDLGDRRGETNVSLLGNPGFAQSVRGAKTGTAALQLGAGLSVPVGTKGTIYVNGNADIRDGSSSVNGSVGYRYDF